jgi:hypothetical protein
VTLAEIDRHLDFVAGLAARWPDRAKLLVPIWRRLELEHAKQLYIEEAMDRMMTRARLAQERKQQRG